MDINDVNQLWSRFEQSEVTEFSLDLDGMKLFLKKNITDVPEKRQSKAEKHFDSEKSEAQAQKDNGEITVKAPLVGTFYCAPSPQDKPFVRVGQKIKKGDVIGLIEAMKLMNEIHSTEDGTVSAIEVKDGSMVEYDEVLIRLKKQ